MNCKKFPPLIFLFQIRSCTMESVAWCKAMFDGNADVRDFSTIWVSKDHVIRVSLGLNVLDDRFISHLMSLSTPQYQYAYSPYSCLHISKVPTKRICVTIKRFFDCCSFVLFSCPQCLIHGQYCREKLAACHSSFALVFFRSRRKCGCFVKLTRVMIHSWETRSMAKVWILTLEPSCFCHRVSLKG